MLETFEATYYFLDCVEAAEPAYQNMALLTAIGSVGSFLAACAAAYSSIISARQAKIHDRPYLSFGEETQLEFTPDVTERKFRARIPLKNVGNIPLYYQVDKIIFGEQEIDNNLHKGQIAVFPGITVQISSPLLNLPSEQSIENFFLKIRIEISYKEINQKRFRHLGRTFEISPHPVVGKGIWTNYHNDFFD